MFALCCLTFFLPWPVSSPTSAEIPFGEDTDQGYQSLLIMLWTFFSSVAIFYTWHFAITIPADRN